MKQLLIPFFLFLMIGCQSEQTEPVATESTGATHEAQLIIHQNTFVSLGYKNEGKYEIGDKVGVVEKKVQPGITLQSPDLIYSNVLKEGTVIYRARGEMAVMLAEKDNGSYELFER
ncbi:hypothetical protein [Halobacillus salinus]|uniref:hypothetical protein n=1 Tax=Halobacillus salinus TaxID=192814 RepID=UPI0009A79AE3|nr:hypothetical protein [Halobacillus salinus]